jgi:hypothetical protein
MGKVGKMTKRGPTMQITVRAFPWDLGPATPAQMQNKVVEEVTHIDAATGRAVNPNQVIRTRRETWVATLHRKGKLSDLQALIAVELVEASLGIVAQDPLAALRIDRAMGDHDAAVARVDARRKFRAMWALVPGYARPVIEHVVLNERSLRSMAGDTSSAGEARHLGRLQRGLDALASGWREG